MKATDNDTAHASAPQHDTSGVTVVTGDALILSLAAEYRATSAVIDTLEDAEVATTGTLATYIRRHQDKHLHRRDAIEEAMCVIPATSMAGAMVQLEILSLMTTRGVPDGEKYAVLHKAALEDAALWSVFGVLARATGRTAADGIEVMKRHRDDTRIDVPALVDEWRAFLGADAEAVAA